MSTSIVSTAIFLILIPIVHWGKYSPNPSQGVSRTGQFMEVAVIIAGLLAIPYLNFKLLWFSDWRSPYLLFGLLVPLVIEVIIRKRSLKVIGFTMPTDRKTIAIVVVLLIIFAISRLAVPLVRGEAFQFDIQRIISNCILFAYVEEVLFRGLLQTRLESLMGVVWSWVLSGLFFGFYHYYIHYLVPGRVLSPSNGFEIMYLTAFGLLLGVIFAKTRSLLPPFLLHAMNNFSL